MAPGNLCDASGNPIPVSVNYFPHRRCNYRCGFCFHTEKNFDMLTLEEAKRGLKRLADAGMQKINISGGEPFLQARFVGEILKYCKLELGVSTGVICNGSKVTLSWLDMYSDYLDVMGVSCDSFDDETNLKIGRSENGGRGGITHTRQVFRVAEWCRDKGIKFKLNTVVNRYNVTEDMNYAIEEINPFRWKVFQVLLLDGENTGPRAIRDAKKLAISSQEFASFLDRHAAQACLVPEDNEAMENSYLNLDEKMRFLNCVGGKKVPGQSILDEGVTVQMALAKAGFDSETFLARGGVYDWTRLRVEDLPDW